jgi:hypothetical protein
MHSRTNRPPSTLFGRARAYAPLTPAERAVLRLLEGLACTALVAALPIVAQALAHGAVNWPDVGRAALAAGAVAVLLALAKYARAHGDPALGDALAASVSALDPPPASQPAAEMPAHVAQP